jgi:hypothetical protein
MQLRAFSEGLYPQIAEWWTSRGVLAWPKQLLLDRGVVAFTDDGEPGVAGWLFELKSIPSAVLGPVISNPALNGERKGMVKAVLETLTEQAKKDGIVSVWGCNAHKSVIKNLLSLGYQPSAYPAVEMVKLLQEQN